MKKILVLFCGGTIVMEKNKQGGLAVPEKDKAIKSLWALEPKLKETTDIDIFYIDNIDSTNITPKHWDKIAEVIFKNYNKYDGFVITHGTDTMAYTSSALSYALQNLGKPVVLTGAQIPGNRIETDARRNFVNAVRVASLDISGVMIVFDEKIILGSRASKVSESKLDVFETINLDLMGEMRIDIILNDRRPKRHGGKVKMQKGFESNIVTVVMFPGFPVKSLEKILASGIKGLILKAYGTGNIAYDYLEIIKKAKQKKIPVIIDTQCLEGATLMHLYDVGRKALQAGAVESHDMSAESVIVKFMWVLKHFPYQKIKKVMQTNYTGEIDPKRNLS